MESDRQDRFRVGVAHAVRLVGPPLLGLPWEGYVSGYSHNRYSTMSFKYRTTAGEIEVVNGKHPLGGTRGLLMDLLMSRTPHKVTFPYELRFDERLVMVPVARHRAQFREISCTDLGWIAAGGFEKRHLRVSGPPGVDLADLALVDVAPDLSGAVSTTYPEMMAVRPVAG